MHDLLEVIADH